MRSPRSDKGFVLYLGLVVLVVVCMYVLLTLTAARVSTVGAHARLRVLQGETLVRSGLEAVRAGIVAGSIGVNGEAPDTVRAAVQGAGTATAVARNRAGWVDVSVMAVQGRDTTWAHAVVGRSVPAFAVAAISVGGARRGVTVGPRARVNGDIANPAATVSVEPGGSHAGAAVALHGCSSEGDVPTARMRTVDERLVGWSRGGIAGGDSVAVADPDSLLGHADRAGRVLVLKEAFSARDGSVDWHGREIWCEGDLSLAGTVSWANVVLYCAGRVTLSGDATLEAATVYALRGIRIDGRASIRADVVSAESLIVTGSAHVWYPSVLHLSEYRPSKQAAVSHVVITDGLAVIYGTIVAPGRDPLSVEPAIVLRGASHVNGVVYTDGAITLYGATTGAVYAERLVYREQGRLFDGWLRETVVRGADLSLMAVPVSVPCGLRPVTLSLAWGRGT